MLARISARRPKPLVRVAKIRSWDCVASICCVWVRISWEGKILVYRADRFANFGDDASRAGGGFQFEGHLLQTTSRTTMFTN